MSRVHRSKSKSDLDAKGADRQCKCLKCTKALDGDSQALECNMCEAWTCLKCTGLTTAVYKTMTADDNDNCVYICQGCLGSLPTLKKISKDVSDIKESTSTRFDELETRVDQIETNMTATVKTQVSELKDSLKSEILEEMEKNLKEKEEKNKRVDNLIFFNVEESDSTIVRERIAHDNELVRKICHATGVEDATVTQIIRLGAKKDGAKYRPLKVKFAFKAQRRSVLMNSKKVQSGDEGIKNVSIARDLTETERNDYKEKVKKTQEELNSRLSSGETGLERRGLRIVKTPGDPSGEPGS